MKVKRFFAPDMRQAMRRVRDEIGPNAVIVSNTRVAGGIEVVAADEREYDVAQEEFQRERASNPRTERRRRSSGRADALSPDQLREELKRAKSRLAVANTPEVSPASKAEGNKQLQASDQDQLKSILSSLKAKQSDANSSRHSQDSTPRESVVQQPALGGDTAEVRAMQDEIRQLKARLAEQAEKVIDIPDLPIDLNQSAPVSENDPLARKLSLVGISERLTQQLLVGVEREIAPEKAWRNTLARLAESIPVVGEDFIERGGMIAFVGPTGVGKTTTIGKLAAQYVLKHGSSSLALVTTDTFRIAAHEQLRTFGRILDVPVRVVNENETLDQVLQSLRNKRLVLVDTAGLNLNEPHNDYQMEMLKSVTVRLKKLMVLSCSSQSQVMDGAYAAYRDLGLNGCVLTKLDESGSLGGAISLAVEQRLPIAYVADGQKIPDDVEVAKKSELVSRAVVTAQKSRATQAQIAQSSTVTPLFKAG